MAEPPLRGIDDVIHAKARLGIMSLVMSHSYCDFAMLKQKLDLTDGNLGSHILKLEQAGYILVEKTFVNRKPKTIISVTKVGALAYEDYIEALEALIHARISPQKKRKD
ncbi:transcriptional regulator [Bacillus sp. JCM 19041]|uniref:winged helix-turn-helix domain-containing protein n=1 Tax=Bacillus sp. JCM 19041 TaxID=1460637 RepID=UPI0006D272CE